MEDALPQPGQTAMERLLDAVYEQVLNGFGVFTSAERLAAEYLAHNQGDPRRAAFDLINWQATKAATFGFITNLGGIAALPVSVPANLSSVIFLQLRMVAAIAILAGYDVRSDKVRTLIYVTLLGSTATEVFKEAGVKLGRRLTSAAIMRLTSHVARRMGKSAVARLMARLGLAQAGRLTRLVPVAGGLIAGAADAATTKAIGKVAVQVFLPVTEEAPTSARFLPDYEAAEQIGGAALSGAELNA